MGELDGKCVKGARVVGVVDGIADVGVEVGEMVFGDAVDGEFELGLWVVG